ncbi:MAG: tetratricopeptide repeat protein [candidate division KSB1 bacterium]|nr:tetratricopeptide repeat protein [candidate division KSB1 bacterium]
MKAKRFAGRLMLSVITVAALTFFSCATSQSGLYAEDEDAIGNLAKESSMSDEEEILTLLGLNKPTPQPTPAESEPKKQQPAAAPKTTDSLTNALNRKEKELRALKEEAELKQSIIRAQEKSLQEAQSVRAYSQTAFRARYDEALRLYHNRRYKEAMAIFDELIRAGGDPSLVDNCQYWKGECLYGVADYEQALLEFQKVFNYPGSNKLDDAQLKIGLCYVRLGNMERAKKEFQKLLDNYPDSEYRERARSYLR